VCKRIADVRCFNKRHVARCSECFATFQPYKGCSLHPYSHGFNLGSKPYANRRKSDINEHTEIQNAEEVNNENRLPDDALEPPQDAHQDDRNGHDDQDHLEQRHRAESIHIQPLALRSNKSEHRRLEHMSPNNKALGTTTYENWRNTKGRAKKAQKVTANRKADESLSEYH
jgi:hypothetical protein